MKKILVAVVVFLDDQNRVLMHHRTGAVNKFGEDWAFLGGGIEEGETPLEAAKREVFEEVGYELSDDQLTYLNFYKEQFNEETEGDVTVYTAKFPGFENFKDTNEVKVESELKLFSLDEAKELKTFSVAYKIIEDIKNSVIKKIS